MEHLGSSDEGVILLRKLDREAMEDARAGRDPRGVVRDPEKNSMIEIIPGEVVTPVS